MFIVPSANPGLCTRRQLHSPLVDE